MNPLNIYFVTRSDYHSFCIYDKNFAKHSEKKMLNQHEFDSLKILVDELVNYHCPLSAFDGFFLSYTIPQIGKEFDLLKMNEDSCLNIELKSQRIDEKKMRGQLAKNRKYLRVAKENIVQFTIVSNPFEIYKLDDRYHFTKTDIHELVQAMEKFDGSYQSKINDCFDVTHYLVSPFNTPERFLNKDYFLTSQQEDIKKRILKSIDHADLLGIYGKAGCGKTLLLYDIAYTLAKSKKVLLIHCAKLNQGQITLDQANKNVSIVPIKKLNALDLNQYDYIFIDEAQRAMKRQVIQITKAKVPCVVSYDYQQVFTVEQEEEHYLDEAIKSENKYKLTGRIRTNRQLATFVERIFNINEKGKQIITNRDVVITYAKSKEQGRNQIQYWIENGYTFLNYSSDFEDYADLCMMEHDAHHIIGQEFDNLVVTIGKEFYYEQERLCSNPNVVYVKLLYQSLTRARKKIAIVVVENCELYQQLMSIY